MLLVVQFPIADGRLFTPLGGTRLPVPDWPSPGTGINSQFVRSFGPAVRRLRGADAAWADESSFCTARRAIRFRELRTQQVVAADRRFTPFCAFRRLFCDGQSVVRVEVGLVLSRDKTLALDLPGLLSAVQAGIELPTEVGPPSQPAAGGAAALPASARPLIKQGQHLADLYARVTTKHNGSHPPQPARLVEPGYPVALVETDRFDIRSDQRSVRVIDPNGIFGANLAHASLRTQWGDVGTWILNRGNATPLQIRSLRLCLLRLHAEQEVLDRILKQMDRGGIVFNPGTDLGDRLEAYLNRATRAINRPVWAGINQSAILEAFDAAVTVDPGRSLLDRYQGARQLVLRKAEEFRKRRDQPRIRIVYQVQEGGTLVQTQGSGQTIVNSTITGDAINAANSTITDSFKHFVGAHPDEDDLKKQITTLHDEVRKLAAALATKSPEQSQNVADNLATFTEEAAKEKPRAGTLRSTGQAIIEAAKQAAGLVSDAASAVAPITAAVTTVLKLVGVVALL